MEKRNVLYRTAASLMAVLMMLTPVLAFAEAEEEADTDDMIDNPIQIYSTEDAMVEEDESNILVPNPGDYEWYMLPPDAEDDHAYLDIFPTEETIAPSNGIWSYAFTLQELNNISFTPTSVTVISFAGDLEVSRDVYTRDAIKTFWSNSTIAGGSSVVYQGSTAAADLTAIAISVIGVDEYDYEMEFHSIVFLSK